MFSKKSRVGKFSVSSETFRNHDAMMLIQDGMYVLQTSYNAWLDRHEFVAVCGEFQEIEECQEPPEYDFEIIKIKDGFRVDYRRKIKLKGVG